MAQDLITDAELDAFGVAPGATSDATPEQRAAARAGASATVQGLLAARYPAPWSSWDPLVKRWVARIAVRDLLSVIGMNPQNEANAEIIRLGQEAHRDARLAGKGDLIVGIVAAASVGDTVAPLEVLSDERAGW